MNAKFRWHNISVWSIVSIIQRTIVVYYVYNETSSVNDQVIFEPRRQETCLGGFRQVFS